MTVLLPIIILLASILLRRTLLWRSVRRHWSLSHYMVALADLGHHCHRVLLALVMLPASLRNAVLLRRWLLVHHRTLVRLHIHVWSRAVVTHRLSLIHINLVLYRHAL